MDWNESEYFAVIRETFEETKIRINENNVIKYKSSADSFENSQNVSFVFYTVLHETVDFYVNKIFAGPDEVGCVEFVHLPKLRLEYYSYYSKCAFGHKEIIGEIFNKRIKISWFKKLILKLYNRYF